MGYSDTPFSDGTAMTRSAVSSELNTMRSWLNGGVVNGDLTDNCVKMQNIANPVVLGFPSDCFEGETQSVAGASKFNDGERMIVDVNIEGKPEKRCNKSDRFDIFHDMIGEKTVPVIGLMKTISIPSAGRVIVHAQFNVEEADTNVTGKVVSAGSACGYFVIARKVRSDGAGTRLVETEVAASRRHLRYHNNPRHIHMIAEINIPSNFGDNDFYVLYNMSGSSVGDNTHIAIGYRSIRVEYEPA